MVVVVVSLLMKAPGVQVQVPLWLLRLFTPAASAIKYVKIQKEIQKYSERNLKKNTHTKQNNNVLGRNLHLLGNPKKIEELQKNQEDVQKCLVRNPKQLATNAEHIQGKIQQRSGRNPIIIV